MMEILGGSFSSRINMNLREDKGYTYGGRAGIGYRRAGAASPRARRSAPTSPARPCARSSRRSSAMRTSDRPRPS
jgi:zinc protease